MNTLVKLVTPFKKVTPKERLWSTVGMVIITFLLWSSSGHSYIPPPIDIVKAYPSLLEQNDLIRNFLKSVTFVLKCMGYSILISYIVCLLSVLPIFKPFCEFLRKFRFLPSAGLSFLFMKLTANMESQMMWMMIFAITTWMIYSFVDIALGITTEEIMYARSLRLTRWHTMREVLIYGKAAEIFNAAIGVFAIAWMMLAAVENIVKANGGIGVVLAESNKYFKMEKVYAVQFLILFTGVGIDYVLRKIKVVCFPYSAL